MTFSKDIKKYKLLVYPLYVDHWKYVAWNDSNWVTDRNLLFSYSDSLTGGYETVTRGSAMVDFERPCGYSHLCYGWWDMKSFVKHQNDFFFELRYFLVRSKRLSISDRKWEWAKFCQSNMKFISDLAKRKCDWKISV